VGQVEDVLTVPLQSVFVREGIYYCFVQESGSPSRREVTLGEANANFAVIKEGVKEGDKVLLWNPEGTEGTAAAPSPAASTPTAGSNGGGTKNNGKP